MIHTGRYLSNIQLITLLQLTSEQVVKAFIERCREVNSYVNAIVEDRFIAALDEAKKVDQYLSSGQKSIFEIEKEMPLLGVPFTVKEACGCAGK